MQFTFKNKHENIEFNENANLTIKGFFNHLHEFKYCTFSFAFFIFYMHFGLQDLDSRKKLTIVLSLGENNRKLRSGTGFKGSFRLGKEPLYLANRTSLEREYSFNNATLSIILVGRIPSLAII